MVITSRWSVPIPRCSLQQWIFESANGPLPDRKAFIDPEKPDTNYVTMSNYRLLAKRVALGLQKAGLQSGDRVLIFSGNNIFFPSFFLGVLMAGGIVTGANPMMVPRELAYQLRDSEAKFMVTADYALKTAMEAAKEAGLPQEKIFVWGGAATPEAPELIGSPTPAPGPKGRINGIKHWTELLAGNLSQAQRWSWQEPTDPQETTCCLNYSSGTTGVPKGVEISHYSYVANGVGVVFNNRLAPDWREKEKRGRALCFLPLYHAYGQTYFVANMTKIGIPVYIMPAFDFIKLLEYIQRFRITTLAAVPPIVILVAKHPLTKKYDLSSLETMGSGGAPLSLEVSQEAQKLLPNASTIRQGWGMTEVTCTSMAWDPNNTSPASGGVGELNPNCKAKLMSLDGKTPVEKANERGELWVTGPTLMRRYWKKPEATADTIVVDSDGTRWLKTGDIAYIEEYKPGGIFHVVDRSKELIKVKGNQVAPAELEGVLLENPDVADAAVIGVTIKGEELPRAYVVKKPGSKASEQDVAKWMESKVTRYKQLKGGVVFVDAIPKNPSGKILRKLLRDRAASEVGDGAPKASKM
ncbi:4-coumarate--CoA ligase-like 7 [Cladorrhinum samala]|uniref:4-coumarate--CoA ligase-like 7 n=1 Tax=Cladorrhinum samala TaxID=585594 RepID=A0AAV9HQN8_9PEZI|nr:4-coumarate--CoA ligase-like 7 [Cladorrhinum samala]